MTETALDKIIRLAGSGSSTSEDETHDFLMARCPWYKAIASGKKPHEEPDQWCQPAKGDGQPPRLVIKLTADGVDWVILTPRTPEASTVPEPTVPPGGPGLFHVKGLQLPPYIQHLWHHLVGRYGKHDAYRVAVGVVKKWAKGVNPGGWDTKSGKGKRTHPDVQAAAQKNVAQWEADIAKGHAHHGDEVRATAPGGPVNSAILPGVKTFPGSKPIRLPSTPPETRQMFTAHRIDDMRGSLSHACERMGEARKAATPEMRGYQMTHVCNHLALALNTGHALAHNFRKHYPAEGGELEAMHKVLGLAVSLSPRTKIATTAHLLASTLNEMTHAKRHADLMKSGRPDSVWEFNADHCEKHLAGAIEHLAKLAGHIKDNYPTEGKYLGRLHTIEDDGDRYVKAAAPAMFPTGKGYQDSFLTLPREDKNRRLATITAPGTTPQIIGEQSALLRQEPSQTVSPSPPLPPKVDLPTPAELQAFANQLHELEADDDASHHIAGAVLHLTTAAEKMANNPVSALYSMRSAQMAIQDEWRERINRAQPRVAYVFSVNAPPAEQRRAQDIHGAQVAYIQQMQAAAQKIATMIDRVRRAWFRHASMEPNTAGGGLAGQPNARM